MVKRTSLLLLSALFVGGCSRIAPTPPSAQSRRKAAQTLVNGITGNAGGSRNKARTLRADSDKRLAAKDYKGAMDKRLQILGVRPKKFACLGALTFYATQSIALGDLPPIASHLDAPSCRKYADQLATIDAQIPSYAQMLQTQKADEIKSITLYTSKPKEWNDAIAGLNFTPQERQTLYNTPVAQLKANIATVYDAEAKRSTGSYSTKPAPLPASIDPYTRIFAQPSRLGRFLWTKAKTERLLAIAALRQRADRLEKKKRVGSLPSDRFGMGPLKEKGNAIYSVGPDTRDDGGKPIPSPMRLRPTDVGDMLAPTF